MGSIQEVVDELHLSLVECNEIFMPTDNKEFAKSRNSLTPSDITHTTSSEPTTTGSSSFSNYLDEKKQPLSTGYERRRSIRRIDRAIKNLQSMLNQEVETNENHIALDDGITNDLIVVVTHIPSLIQKHEDEENTQTYSFYESTCEVSSCIILDYCSLPFQNTQYIDALLDRCITLCLNRTDCSGKLYPILSILNANLFHQQENLTDQNHNSVDDDDDGHDDGGGGSGDDHHDESCNNETNKVDSCNKIFPSLTIDECLSLLEVMVPIALIDFHKKSWKPPDIGDDDNTINENEVTGPIHLRLFLSFLIRYLFSIFSKHDKNNDDGDDNDASNNKKRFQSVLNNHLHPFLIEMIEYSLDVIEGSSSYLKIKTNRTTSSSNHVQLVIQDVIQHVSLTLEFIHISQQRITLENDIIISLWTSFTNYVASFSSYIDHNSYQDSEENVSMVVDDLLLRLLKCVLIPLQQNDHNKKENTISVQYSNSFITTLIMSFLRLLTSDQQNQRHGHEQEHSIDLITKMLLSCTSSDNYKEWIHVLQSSILSTMVLPTMHNDVNNDPAMSSFSQVNHLVQILLAFLERQQNDQQEINRKDENYEEKARLSQNDNTQDNATEIDPWNYLIVEKMVEMNKSIDVDSKMGYNKDDDDDNDNEKDQTPNSVKQYIDFVLLQEQAQDQKEPPNDIEMNSAEENETNTINIAPQKYD